MSGQDRKNFDDRLADLSNWQIEQQRKFQEAQRKLLNLEYKTVLSTQNFGQKVKEIEIGSDIQNLRTKEPNGVFHFKCPEIKLPEPKSLIINMQNHSARNEKVDSPCKESADQQEGTSRPKRFLKRGEGLARFRMTLEDFKGPPKIYRDNKIRTYLSGKPEPQNGNPKVLKINNKCSKNSLHKMQIKSNSLPVKIYVFEKKNGKQCNSGKSSESSKPSKETKTSKKLPQFCKKVPMENLALKQHSIATEWYKAMKEKEKAEGEMKLTEIEEDKGDSPAESDVENKKDEKELRIFELLEKKVDDTSFCSNSSFVDKLLEQSQSSTPSRRSSERREIAASYGQDMKSLRSRFLDEKQINKTEELDKIALEVAHEEMTSEAESDHPEEGSVVEENANGDSEEVHEGLEAQPPQVQNEVPERPEPHKVNKTLLQEYIKDFKKFKFMLAENVHRIEEEEAEKEPSPKELMKEGVEEKLSQHEIALTLRRKGLQDNVKQLLNWECPPRKRQPKRVVKKIKPKTRLEKSKSVSKDQGEKIVFNSSLLYERLNELEKEIEIFRKENGNLERLQKECAEEKQKLSRERKEFEKQMQEEREKLEAKIAEDQKKLQKEKTVFEKYCKQVKNQPTRQEREETAKLKKEIEKLTETLSTKESRLGAAQARLRNQLKNLEKENSQLKADLEKYKKLSAKKVSFESDRNLNTKIIHAINSELGKLKPTVMKTNPNAAKNQPLSARGEREPEARPIRRIMSAPNVKRPLEIDLCVEGSNDCDEKALGSVSTDSGIETNGSRYLQRGEKENLAFRESKVSEEVAVEEPCRGPVKCLPGRKSDEVTVDSVLHEAIFHDDAEETNRKIAEMRNRLGRLSLLGSSEGRAESHPVRMVNIPLSRISSDSEEESSNSPAHEEEEGEKGLEILNCSLKKGQHDPYIGPYTHKKLLESKLDENGVWEKLFDDGSKEMSYPNGNVKKIFPGSKIVRMTYYNGDVKETNVVEGSEKYYYAETKTWHTSYKDGLEVLEFPNGQTERRHADGSAEISFPNGCVRYCDPTGKDEWRFPDGTVIKTNEHGHKILLLPNGQKEIHTKEFKRREYPDGTVKILYADGTQETRYSSGRVRLKDKDGNLLMDSGGIR